MLHPLCPSYIDVHGHAEFWNKGPFCNLIMGFIFNLKRSKLTLMDPQKNKIQKQSLFQRKYLLELCGLKQAGI
jgi:hypothetical protein